MQPGQCALPRAGSREAATGAVVRYLDPKKPDAAIFFHGRTTSYLKGNRFTRETASDERCRGCHQPYWAYALPETEEYSYRLLGTISMLACLTAEHEPAGIIQSDKGLTFVEEPFQRPKRIHPGDDAEEQ
jgi:hypothetical protein